MLHKKFEKGDIYIFDDVVKFIMDIAFSEIEGVECSHTSIKGKIIDTVTRNNSSIQIKTKQDQIYVDIKVSVALGIKIIDTIYQLQQIIKNHIELYTGFEVIEINCFVDHVLPIELKSI